MSCWDFLGVKIIETRALKGRESFNSKIKIKMRYKKAIHKSAAKTRIRLKFKI